MSHCDTTRLLIKDLATLKKVLREDFPGAELVKDDEFNWFGEHVGDYPVPPGFSKEDMGKCEWKIRVPGINYEIGLAKAKGADGYSLLFDFYGRASSKRHDGPKLLEKFGDGKTGNKLCKLATAYRHEILKKEARRMGKTVELIDSEEKLSAWNKSMKKLSASHKPVKWTGKTLSIVMGK